MPAERIAKKNTSRSKCKGHIRGGGRPGFKHLCVECGNRFCPECVKSSARHKRTVTDAEPEPSEQDRDPLITEDIRAAWDDSWIRNRKVCDRNRGPCFTRITRNLPVSVCDEIDCVKISVLRKHVLMSSICSIGTSNSWL